MARRALRSPSGTAIPATPRHSAREPIWSGIIRGYRATGQHRILAYYVVATGPLNGAFYAVYYLCLPLLIARSGNGEAGAAGLGAYGLVLSAYGCGNHLAWCARGRQGRLTGTEQDDRRGYGTALLADCNAAV